MNLSNHKESPVLTDEEIGFAPLNPFYISANINLSCITYEIYFYFLINKYIFEKVFYDMKFILYLIALFSFSFISAQEMNEKQQQSFDDNFFDGVNSRLKEDYKRSNDFFFACAELNPQNDVVLFKIAQNYLDLNDLTKAEEFNNKALKINPDNKWYTENLIRIKIKQGESDKEILKLIENFRKQAHNKYLIAELYRELYSQKKKQSGVRITTKNRKKEDPKNSLKQLYNVGKYKKLIEKGEKLLDKSPENPNTYLWIAKSYSKLNQNKNALEYLDMGIDFVLNKKALLKEYYLLYSHAYKQMGKLKKSNYYKLKSEKL